MFRKKKYGARFTPPTAVYEQQMQTVFTEDGNTQFQELTEVDVTDPDLQSLFPEPEEYTLANLMQAGLPIDKVPSNVLTPDSADYLNDALNAAIPNETNEE